MKTRTKAKVCGTKRAHDTKQEAEKQLYSLLRSGRISMHVYKCKFCKKFHVGHY